MVRLPNYHDNDTVHCKSFEVENFHGMQIKLLFTGKLMLLDISLV